MPGAAFTLDRDALISSWGDEAAAWFDRPASRAVGRHYRSVFSRAVADALEKALDSTGAGKEYRHTLSMAATDRARTVHVRLNCSPIAANAGLLCQISEIAEDHGSETRTVFVDSVMRASPFGLGMLDDQLRYVMVNDALAEFNGVPAEEHIGRRVDEVVRAVDGGEYERQLRRVLETGEPLANVVIGSRSQGRPDRDRAWSITFFRLTGGDGRVLGLGGLVVDVTQRHTALVEASAVRQRLALVNRASSKVGTMLDMERSARELTYVVVPEFADMATVEIREDLADESMFPPPDQPVSTLCLASHGTADDSARAPLIVAGGECRHAVGSPSHTLLCTGRAWHTEKLDDPSLCSTPTEDGLTMRSRGSRHGSVIMAPLVARGRCLGLVTFARSAERDPLSGEDLKAAEELALRTALSLDNARMYEEERRVAIGLQQSMLPSEEELPKRPGLEISHRYWSSSRSANVGGDWFDVIPLSGHRVALVVGDMMGHDIRAAAGMGQLRTAMRTLAGLDLEPVDLLNRLDTIVQHSPGMQYATCVYAVYNTVSRECGIVNAGHPPPVLRHSDGSTTLVEVDPGVPLGVGMCTAPKFSAVDLVLPEESTLVLYTDGLVERRDENIDVGIGVLRTALTKWTPSSLERLCDGVFAELKQRAEDDDLAMLMARAGPAPGHRCDRRRLAPEPGSVSVARRWVRARFADWDLEALEDSALLLTSELVTNAVRHAREDIGLRLLRGETVVIEVTDDDDRLPGPAQATAEDEWGRGLALVDEIALRWGARSIASGKVVWFELALPGACEEQAALASEVDLTGV